ncbi:MAG: hypothetical protein HY300_08630 [Verrucomicrobia bacterium]|nr:hypothetical protein [Verrucomicrobiota bacterium]
MPSAAQLLQSKAAIFIVGALSFSATLAILLPNAIHPPARLIASGMSGAGSSEPSSEVTPPAPMTKSSWDFQNPSERIEINVLLQQLKKMQADFDKSFLYVQEEETTNLKRLAKMYAQMEPANAAAILKELEDTAVVKIMVFMKEQETAPILETLAKTSSDDTKRAAKISEQIRLTMSKKAGAAKAPAP